MQKHLTGKSDPVDTVIAINKLTSFMEQRRKRLVQLLRGFESGGRGQMTREDLYLAISNLPVQLTSQQFLALLNFADSEGTGRISIKNFCSMVQVLQQRLKEGFMGHDALELPKDTVFPNWLISRADFQLVFSRFLTAGGRDLQSATENSLRKNPFERVHEDLQYIANWLSQSPALQALGAQRCLEFASVVRMEDHAPGHVVFAQGSISDAFYVVHSGSVDVEIDGVWVANLAAGATFGEMGLDSNAARIATIRASQAFAVTSVVNIRLTDYKHIMSKVNAARMARKIDLLSRHCRFGADWSCSKIRAFSYCMAYQRHPLGKVVYDTSEVAHTFYIVASGTAVLQRKLVYRLSNRWPGQSREGGEMRAVQQVITVNLRDVKQGDTFGEDAVLGFDKRQYQVVVTSEALELFVVSRESISTYLTAAEVDRLAAESRRIYQFGDEITNSWRYYDALQMHRSISKKKIAACGPSYTSRIAASASAAELPSRERSASPTRPASPPKLPALSSTMKSGGRSDGGTTGGNEGSHGAANRVEHSSKGQQQQAQEHRPALIKVQLERIEVLQ